MKTGRLSESVGFETKERAVRERLSIEKLEELNALQNRDHKAYVEFIEEDYKNLDLVHFWEEYVDIHGTSHQINDLLDLKGTNTYPTKLYMVYRGLVNHAKEV